MSARILVVDDDKAHLTMLVAMLTSWGHEVVTAADGAEAVATVREAALDAVLTDVRMAEVDGIEALRRIRDYNPFLPVLIMTAYSSLGTAVEALKAGAYDYLPKPLKSSPYYHVWCKARADADTPALMAAYDAELLHMKQDGRLKALYDKYGIPYLEP